MPDMGKAVNGGKLVCGHSPENCGFFFKQYIPELCNIFVPNSYKSRNFQQKVYEDLKFLNSGSIIYFMSERDLLYYV